MNPMFLCDFYKTGHQEQYPAGRSAATKITPSAGVMLETFQKSGLIEADLRDKIATLKLELRESRRANGRKKQQLRQVDRHMKTCWGCRLRRWVRRLFKGESK